jgi:hypothetical protein
MTTNQPKNTTIAKIINHELNAFMSQTLMSLSDLQNIIRHKTELACFQELDNELPLTSADPQDFQSLKKQADKIADLHERELFLFEQAIRHRQDRIHGDLAQQLLYEIDLVRAKRDLTKTVGAGSASPTGSTCPQSNTEENVASLKVRSMVILELLKKQKIGTAYNDLTKICRLIAFLTGNSYKSIYAELQKGVRFTKYHLGHIAEANRILGELGAGIVIERD